MERETWRGVNLGGWLIIEKWMTPSLFEGRKALDEYSLCQELGEKAKEVLTNHRRTFIKEADFAWLAKNGINSVRLPVGYWILGDDEPYIGGIEFVDKAMKWAEKHKLRVILDLHGAPGSQNGKDHSGRIGKMAWKRSNNINHSLDVLEALAKRYGRSKALVGIELLNEPSWKLGKRRLTKFYKQAYSRVRKHAAQRVAVIFPDAFKPKRWRRTLRGKKYKNVMLDVHYYQLFNRRDRRRSAVSHIKQAFRRHRTINKLQKIRPVIVGEWSAALPARAYQSMGKLELQRTYASAQITGMEQARGWFYWNYKIEAGGPWNYRDCVERGIL